MYLFCNRLYELQTTYWPNDSKENRHCFKCHYNKFILVGCCNTKFKKTMGNTAKMFLKSQPAIFESTLLQIHGSNNRRNTLKFNLAPSWLFHVQNPCLYSTTMILQHPMLDFRKQRNPRKSSKSRAERWLHLLQ